MNPLVNYMKDGFVFFIEKQSENSLLGDRLIIDSARKEETIKYIRNEKIKSIVINNLYFKEDNLNFLTEIKDVVQGVYLLKQKIDSSALNALQNLKALAFDKTDNDLDFANFPDLEVLGLTYSKHIKNLDKCTKLFWLWMDGLKDDSLSLLRNFRELKFLTLGASGAKSLEGIESLNELMKIKLEGAPKLETLTGLTTDMNKLEVLDIAGAKKLSDYDDIRKLTSLKKLYIMNSGETPDLDFLTTLTRLKTVHFNINVSNGKITIPASAADVYFKDYPDFNIKLKKFKETLPA